MKALSLHQPWASTMALGLKRIETRSWKRDYRGLVAIHAAKHRMRPAERAELMREISVPFRFLDRLDDLDPLRLDAVPYGAFVAVGDLAEILSTERMIPGVTQCEHVLGNYGPDRWAWLFRGIQPLKKPVAFSAQRGLFGLSADVQKKIEDQL